MCNTTEGPSGRFSGGNIRCYNARVWSVKCESGGNYVLKTETFMEIVKINVTQNILLQPEFSTKRRHWRSLVKA
jgi:hypothetical protein